MKHKLFLLFLSVAILLGLSMTALASTLTLTFESGSGNYPPGGGPPTGAYHLMLSDGATSQAVNLICDDYAASVSWHETWQVTEHSINDLSGAKFGNNVQTYAEALWIADDMLTHPGMPGGQVSTDQYAIWKLFDTNLSLGYVQSIGVNGVQAELDSAMAWWTNICQPNETACLAGLADLIIYTPVPGTQVPERDGPPQEFIGTPEPASMFLLGSFLSLAGGLLSKKTRRA